MKESIQQANYRYLTFLGNRQHLLLNLNSKKQEVFFSNKNHASWGLIYKNTHLEFASSLVINQSKRHKVTKTQRD